MHRHALTLLHAAADLAGELRHQGPHPISRARIGMLASIATTLTPHIVNHLRENYGIDDVTLHAG